MNLFRALLITTFAGLSTVVGGCIVFFKIKKKEEFISFCLSFSLSVMITLSVTDLLPNSFITISNNYGVGRSIIYTIIIFIIAIITINLINLKLKKVRLKENNLYKLGILSMIALALHNFPEGIATFMTSYTNLSLGISLGLAIMAHNIPEGIAISVPLYYATGKKGKGILYSLISGLTEPLGAIMTYIFLRNYINAITISFVLIFVAGIMITLAINELYPEALKYNKKKEVYLGLILGIVVILINHYLF